MPDVLLHQYDSSPFSEKVRICLGIKGLAWSAVEQPVIMPKPDLVALTGGYRRIPVMQIGADIYCDSQLIVRELERRFPDPTLFPAKDVGLGYATGLWTDRQMFQAAVAIIFGGLGDRVPSAFVEDREKLSGRAFDLAAMRAAAPHAMEQIRAHAALISDQLADGRKFLSGELPSLVDANAYYNLWFIKHAFPPGMRAFREIPGISRWMEEVANLGHGQRSELSGEAAISIAKEATPLPTEVAQADADLAGQQVAIAADDYGRDPIRGVFVGSSDHHVAISRKDEKVGDVVVHFPRIGFVVQPENGNG